MNYNIKYSYLGVCVISFIEVLNIFIRFSQIYQRFKTYLFKTYLKIFKYDFILCTCRIFKNVPQNKDDVSDYLTFKDRKS